MEKTVTLSRLSPGERGIVLDLTTVGAMRRRLLDIGLLRGTEVTCVGQSPAGDPRAYLICGAVIAIRRRDADTVLLSRCRNG